MKKSKYSAEQVKKPSVSQRWACEVLGQARKTQQRVSHITTKKQNSGPKSIHYSKMPNRAHFCWQPTILNNYV